MARRQRRKPSRKLQRLWGSAKVGLKDGDYQRARDLLASCPPDLRHWEWRHLSRLAREEIYPIRMTSPVVGMCFSPRSDLLAIATARELSVWDFGELPPQRIAQVTADAAITAVAFDPRGDRIATGHVGGAVRFWSPHTLKPVGNSSVPALEIKSLVLLPEGNGFVCLSAAGRVCVQREINGKTDIKALDDAGDDIINIALSDDGNYIAGGCKNEKLRVWDLAAGKVQVHGQIQRYQAQPIGVAFMPGGKSIVYATSLDAVAARDRDSGVGLWSQNVPGTRCFGFSAAANGMRVCVAYWAGMALYDPNNGGARVRLFQTAQRGEARCPALRFRSPVATRVRLPHRVRTRRRE